MHKEFLAHLREVLTYLYDPHFLQHSPLLAELDLGHGTEPSSALRNTLIAAIETLKPSDAVPAQTREWRIYELLFYRYVQQLSQQEVADQLGIGVRHLRREQTIALEALGERLKDRLTQIPAVENPPPSDEDKTMRPLDEELAWLRDSPPEKITDLYQELPMVLRLLRPLALQHEVQLHLDMRDDLVEAVVHPVGVRQILLSVLNSAILCHPVRRVSITAQRQETNLAIHIQFSAHEGQDICVEESGLGTAQRLAQLCGCAVKVSVSQQTVDVVVLLPGLGQVPVLVVDDNPDTLELFRRYTLGTRYRLIGLRAAARTLQVAEEVAPRLIIIDIMMPQLDGWEVMGQILHHPHTGHIPVLVCSIVAQKELALSLGASGFIQKPVTRQSLISALERHLSVDKLQFP